MRTAPRTGQPKPPSPAPGPAPFWNRWRSGYRYALDQLTVPPVRPFAEIRVFGGGCRNTLLNQFTADATGCRVLAGPAEATALGNIAMQFVGAAPWAPSPKRAGWWRNRSPWKSSNPRAEAAGDAAYRQFASLVTPSRET